MKIRVLQLTTPDGKEMEFVTEPVVTAKGVGNRAKVNQLDASQGSEVPVVNVFPDVFPEEWRGMPPDQDIESVIELKPRTVEVVLRHFHRCRYRSSPLWFFCWRGSDRTKCWLSGNTVDTRIYVVRATRA
jgi:hypothetical protein